MKKTDLALALILMLLAVLAYMFLQQKPVSQTSVPLPPSAPTPRSHRPKVIPDNRVADVEKILKANRTGIGVCLQGVEESRMRDLRITVIWNTLGKLEKVRLAPNIGEKAEQCIFDLLVGSQIPPAADLTPLAVTQRLRLGL